MSARLISNRRYALLAVLITVGSFIVASQQLLNSERATIATPLGSQEADKPAAINTAKATKQDPGAGDNALWSTPLTSLAATRERPIFSPTRRAPPAPFKSVPAQAPSAAQPPLALVGAIAGEDEGIAILLDGTTKTIIRMKTGESRAGWTLQAVKAREAILQKDQKTAVLVLLPPAK